MEMVASQPRRKLQFLRVLVNENLDKPSVPRIIAKKISKDINRAILLSPLGSEWSIVLEREGSKLFLGSGWKNFVQAHGLEVGFFLLFKYYGGGVFSVTVFDHTTCTKDYGSINPNTAEEEKHNGRGDVSAENQSLHVKKPIKEETEIRETKGRIGFGRRPITRSQKMEPWSTTSNISTKPSFKSAARCQEPLRFGITMKPTYVCRFQMEIPVRWIESFGLIERDEVELRNSEGKSWCVSVRSRKGGGGSRIRYFLINEGWRSFVLTNNLEVGDKCVFKLASKSKGIINVQIIKHN